MPFFSIIIPTYNSVDRLARALNSIKDQTFCDYEILLIDGLSSDNTIEIIKEFAANDSRIKWMSEKDEGVYDAMNKGIKLAEGDWIFFLGSDDYLYQADVLTEIHSTASKNERADIIYGNVTSSYLGEKYLGPFDRVKITNSNLCHQSVFYKRTVFELIGNYNLKYKILGDWDFNIRSILHPKVEIQYVDIIVSYFSGGGLSHRQDDYVFRAVRNQVIAHNGYHTLPYKNLKYFCKSNQEFFFLSVKRALYFLKKRIRFD